MPCRDYEADAAYARSSNDELRKKVDDLTRMLCAVCGVWGKANTVLPPEVQTWWTKHQQQDRERIAKEEREKKDQIERLKAEQDRLAMKIKLLEGK